MKRNRLKNYAKWKSWKRKGFHFWFMLLSTIVVVVTIGISDTFSALVQKAMPSDVQIPTIVFTLAFGLVIGGTLSALAGFMLIKPINKLQSAMSEVADGDLEVCIEEKNLVEEVENIFHSFNIMVKELRANQAMQKDFISNVSHEFKTPLSTIEGYATLLQDTMITAEERGEYTREILSTTRRMTELVGNILLLSKISNQAIDFKKERFFIDEQIRKTVVMLEPHWAEKNIEFDVEMESLEYLCNEVLLYNVWRNLIENAIKFSPYGGKITILLKKDNGKISFTVLDQGEGVKDEDKKYIFDKFYQADTSHKQEGNGLGLSLVKNILNLFNGKITVESPKEGGCAFVVELPSIE